MASLSEELAGEVYDLDRGISDAFDALIAGRLDECRTILQRLIEPKWWSQSECNDQYEMEVGR